MGEFIEGIDSLNALNIIFQRQNIYMLKCNETFCTKNVY